LKAAQAKNAGVWGSDWEVGDRVEVRACWSADGSLRLAVAPEILESSTALKVLENDAGRPIAFIATGDKDIIELAGPAGRNAIDRDVEAVWLVISCTPPIPAHHRSELPGPLQTDFGSRAKFRQNSSKRGNRIRIIRL
jgi:hypothetical protein